MFVKTAYYQKYLTWDINAVLTVRIASAVKREQNIAVCGTIMKILVKRRVKMAKDGDTNG